MDNFGWRDGLLFVNSATGTAVSKLELPDGARWAGEPDAGGVPPAALAEVLSVPVERIADQVVVGRVAIRKRIEGAGWSRRQAQTIAADAGFFRYATQLMVDGERDAEAATRAAWTFTSSLDAHLAQHEANAAEQHRLAGRVPKRRREP